MPTSLMIVHLALWSAVLTPPCTDAPPSGWSVESTALSLSRHDPCVDLLIADDGSVIVAARDANGVGLEVLSNGAWSTAFQSLEGGCPVLAEANGVMRVAFSEPAGVRVATRTGSVWPSEHVSGIEAPFAILPDGRLRSVGVDPFGEALVLHESGATEDVIVAIPGTPIGGNIVDLVAMALGADGSTHVLFRRNTRPALEYATNASGTWRFEVADPLQFDRTAVYWGWSNNPPPVVGFVIDAEAHAHLAYRLKPSMKLAYATNASGTWRREIVDHGAPVSLDVALRLSAEGVPWLAWQRVAAGDLVVSTRANDGWTTVTVDALDTAGTARGLALGPDGRWHLAFSRFGGNLYGWYDARPIQHAVSVPCVEGRAR